MLISIVVFIFYFCDTLYFFVTSSWLVVSVPFGFGLLTLIILALGFIL